MGKEDEALSAAVFARIASAKAQVRTLMAQLGLQEKDGWRLAEELRSTPDGTQFVYRPIHTRLDSPDIESTVTIDSNGCPL